MSNKTTKILRAAGAVGAFALRATRKYGPAALLMLAAVGARADATGEVDSMWQELEPLINKVLSVAIVIAVAWVAVMFFMGKKTALTIGGFVLLGAVIFRIFPGIIKALMQIE
jgi:hypothetical protein